MIAGGRYELLHVAGKGGMAEVWRAVLHDGTTTRPVAVKRILFDIQRDPAIVALFKEEARVGSQLRHPNIVRVLEFGRDESGSYFLVLEWVEGMDFLEYMRSFHATGVHVPWQAVAAFGYQALRGLTAAHERLDSRGNIRPVIHRDLSPSNLLLGIDGILKIADFGLSRATDRATMTFPNIIKGKVSYTAPELTTGQRASTLSDIYCLGVTLWESLAARKLFAGSTYTDVIRAMRAWQVPDLGKVRPDAPAALVQAIERAISKDPMQRFASAREMSSAFAAVLRTTAQPVDPSRLGASVRSAKARLAKLAPEPAPVAEPEEDSLMDSFELTIDSQVDYPSSPSAARNFRRDLSEPFTEDIDEMPTVKRPSPTLKT